jgi:hypothetical protein
LISSGQVQNPELALFYLSCSKGSPEQASWLICFSFGRQSTGI